MTRLPASLRLATRELRRHPATFLLTAVFLALPTIILVVVNVVSASTATDDTRWAPLAATAAAATLAVPLGLAIVVMVGANLLVAARRNERTFALLGSIGAAPSTLFRVVSANGLLSGVAAAALTVIVGIPAAWLWAGALVPVDAIAVTLLAALAVALGWMASVVPAIVATQVDVTRVLRAIPVPVRRRWRTDRIGLVLAMVGLVAMVLGAVVSLLLQRAYADQNQPDFWLGAIGSLGASALSQFGMLLIIIGVALALPALFRMLARPLSRLSLAARLATRDAERGWNRSVSAGVTVLVTTLAIGFYLNAASASSAGHWWQLQEGQVAVSLIDLGYQNGAYDPQPIDNIDAVTDALRDSVELGELRTLHGVQGPFYGWPVEENEGYSGRQELVFPEGGLPHPVLAERGICELGELPAWRCETPHHYDSRFFPLSPLVPKIWVGDAADLRLILGGGVDATMLDALDRGDALVFDPRYLAVDGTVTIDWAGQEFVPEDEPREFLPAGAPVKSATIDGQLVPLEHALDYGVFLSVSTATELGLEPRPSRLLGTLSEPLVGDDYTAAMDAVREAAVPGDPNYWLEVTVENGPSEVDAAWRIGAMLVAIGIALAVSLIAVGLARLDGRPTDRTLAALGADPSIRRRISGWYALIVVGVPSVIGTALAAVSSTISMAGLGAVVTPLPWLELVLLALGLPLLAAVAAWLRPRSRQR